MAWLAFKAVFVKTWVFLKEHWQIPFLVVWSVIVWVLARRNTDAILEVIEAKKESYKKQVEVLKSTHNDELLKREKLEKEYEASLAKVEENFESRNKKLSEDQKNEIKKVVIKSKGDPDEIKKRIEKEFGLKFVE